MPEISGPDQPARTELRPRPDDELTAALGSHLYDQMALIRAFETTVRELYTSAELEGGMHLSVGQEAVAVGVCSVLLPGDIVTSTHRPHGHCLALGSDPRRVMAELFGKVTGLCRGKGGSMHLADLSVGFLGANGVVGANGPLACGAALQAKLARTGAVAICFFGDGGAQQGAMHEAMNLAAVWSLPVVFVCENNGYAQTTPVGYHSSVPRISDRAAGYGMPGILVDGQDIMAVRSAAADVVCRAASGAGPALLEAVTWRSFGHFEGDLQLYRPVDERAGAASRDPLDRFGAVLAEHGLATKPQLATAREVAAVRVTEALAYARKSDYPDVSEAMEDVYVGNAAYR